MNGIETLGSERLDVEALKKYPCPAACARLWRQPSLFGDDTHAEYPAKVGTRGRTLNKDVGRSEHKTPTP